VQEPAHPPGSPKRAATKPKAVQPSVVVQQPAIDEVQEEVLRKRREEGRKYMRLQKAKGKRTFGGGRGDGAENVVPVADTSDEIKVRREGGRAFMEKKSHPTTSRKPQEERPIHGVPDASTIARREGGRLYMAKQKVKQKAARLAAEALAVQRQEAAAALLSTDEDDDDESDDESEEQSENDNEGENEDEHQNDPTRNGKDTTDPTEAGRTDHNSQRSELGAEAATFEYASIIPTVGGGEDDGNQTQHSILDKMTIESVKIRQRLDGLEQKGNVSQDVLDRVRATYEGFRRRVLLMTAQIAPNAEAAPKEHLVSAAIAEHPEPRAASAATPRTQTGSPAKPAEDQTAAAALPGLGSMNLAGQSRAAVMIQAAFRGHQARINLHIASRSEAHVRYRFWTAFMLENAIGSYTCWFEVNKRVFQ
jgi:hypothetical protein